MLDHHRLHTRRIMLTRFQTCSSKKSTKHSFQIILTFHTLSVKYDDCTLINTYHMKRNILPFHLRLTLSRFTLATTKRFALESPHVTGSPVLFDSHRKSWWYSPACSPKCWAEKRSGARGELLFTCASDPISVGCMRANIIGSYDASQKSTGRWLDCKLLCCG